MTQGPGHHQSWSEYWRAIGELQNILLEENGENEMAIEIN